MIIIYGAVALVGGLRCYFDTEYAGVFRHPAAGMVAMMFPAAMMAFVAAIGGDVAGTIFPLVLATGMSIPLLAYHLVNALSRMLSPVSQPAPEPEDPFERAKAAEDRGDTVIAVERYMRLLEGEPSHEEARTRLMEILARTGRVEWSRDVIERGLALPEVGPAARAEWRALILKWKEGKGGDVPPRDGKPRMRGLEDSPTTRLDAHVEASSGRCDESPVPFDGNDEEDEADGAAEEDDDSPVPFS